jgi:hypothetical protein
MLNEEIASGVLLLVQSSFNQRSSLKDGVWLAIIRNSCIIKPGS